jgi:NAD(P)-dependent dehydrogenase (short-subunit alcohol dehydrogenase family)
MKVLVTGATGFIGRFLLERLLAQPDATVYALIRESSAERFGALQQRCGEAGRRLRPIYGDVTAPGVVAPAVRRRLRGGIDHIFHLAAVYDMTMDDATADRVNVQGTANLVALANAIGAPAVLHHVSSLGVAGADFGGRFTEDMFDQGQALEHPYYRTTYQAEAIVRGECRLPFRIYRTGAVVGAAATGEIEKIDGPYYFFKAIQRISQRLPAWLPLLRIEGGRVPIAPVDYVADALAVLARQPGLDGQCFHLIQQHSPSVGDLLQLFLETSYGPDLAARLKLPRIPRSAARVGAGVSRALPYSIQARIARAIGVPLPVIAFALNRSQFDDSKARAALAAASPDRPPLSCPDIRHYADRLWQYWELYLDRVAPPPPAACRALQGKVVLVTGASSGIGLQTAKKLAAAGARVVLVARDEGRLELTRSIIEKAGGEARVYRCDLSDLPAIDAMSAQVLADFGHVDILINNAGHSIRRGVLERFTRFQDFQRTMQLNYFGAVRLTLNLLPTMLARKHGHIVNISSIGVLANAARFSAYVASKAALDAFTRCLSAEVRASHIRTTAIYMPLVRTPMIAPTRIYDYMPTWSPERAADTVIRAITDQPKSIATPLGTAAAVSYALWPKLNDYVLSMGYQLFPPSLGSRGGKKRRKPSLKQILFTSVFKGEYW